MIKQTFYKLPEDQCERLTQPEMNALMRLYNSLSDQAHFPRDAGERLDCIPNGRVRLRLATGLLRAVINDITGTIPVQQAKKIKGIMHDMESRLVPKFTPTSGNILLQKDQAKELVDLAQVACKDCIKDSEECRSCALFNLLAAITPTDEKGGFLCPYSRAEWAD